MNATPLSVICVRASVAVALVAGVIAGTAAQAPSTPAQTPVHYSAIATNVDPSVNLTATTVHIAVDRWSTDAERDRLLDTTASGQRALVKALQDMPKAGRIMTPDSVAYDLRYARQLPSDDGSTQVVLVTDRHIGFFEATSQARTVDYPFMVIELRLDEKGEGEGKITVATKITASPKTRHIILENYGSQPVRLTRVKRVDG
jgi:hypothetical protein